MDSRMNERVKRPESWCMHSVGGISPDGVGARLGTGTSLLSGIGISSGGFDMAV